ncbi:MAG: BON domain-containing protein [Alphaproteobacteria bacterium]|nr:BON domain-containing protein [Alphaproteobacteria bacterium]
MTDKRKVIDEVLSALHGEPRFGPGGHVALEYADGTLTIEGEVEDIAIKKLLLERAAAHPAVDGIVDRLHVWPAEPMGDKEIRDLVRHALLQDSALAEITLRDYVKGRLETVREPPAGGRGEIRIRVEDGVVTLEGDAPTLAHKRLAGVLAWWVPGSRDVINGLGVLAPETDLDAETTDAVHMVLEKDPFVDASQIRILTQDAKVILHGVVPTEMERDMAEFDAWYVFGVDQVENKIKVRA